MTPATNTAYYNPAVENIQAKINTIVDQGLNTVEIQMELQELYYQREYLMERDDLYDTVSIY